MAKQVLSSVNILLEPFLQSPDCVCLVPSLHCHGINDLAHEHLSFIASCTCYATRGKVRALDFFEFAVAPCQAKKMWWVLRWMWCGERSLYELHEYMVLLIWTLLILLWKWMLLKWNYVWYWRVQEMCFILTYLYGLLLGRLQDNIIAILKLLTILSCSSCFRHKLSHSTNQSLTSESIQYGSN